MLKSVQDKIVLKSGVGIPCVGYGTWQSPNDATTTEAVKAALACGYRHIDEASVYGNEESVGVAIREAGIAREELFVTSKLWNIRAYKDVEAELKASLQRLGLDYLDLYLIHWPNHVNIRDHWQEANAEAWSCMEDMQKAGLIRSIGVSNFHAHHLEALMKQAHVMPDVNQIMIAPGFTQQPIIDFCEAHGIRMEAYSPLGTGNAMKCEALTKLAEKYGKSNAQVALRWHVQKGIIPLPKSMNPERMKQNTELFDFEISPEDMEILTHMEGCARKCTNPDEATF